MPLEREVRSWHTNPLACQCRVKTMRTWGTCPLADLGRLCGSEHADMEL